MPKTQSHSTSSAGRLEPLPGVNFKEGGGAIIKSNHPLFPGAACTITALPSPDAAIVQLSNGSRERLLLKYLKPLVDLEQAQGFNADKSDSSGVETNQNNSIAPPFGDRSDTSDIQELSLDEERERHRLEIKVEKAFIEAGSALRDLRDLRLYRSTHKTFEEYCQDRFGYTRRNANYTIAAAAVVENLGKNLSQNDLRKNLGKIGTQILPTNSEQVRHLTKLQPEEQRACWQQALLLADGKVPTGKIVKGIVERMKEKPLNFASDYCSVGEIFRLQRLRDDDQKYNGWWAIALEVENRFSVKCQVYDKTIEIRLENILRVDMDKQQQVLQQEIISRVARLARCNLDPVVWAMLEVLNRQAYYTKVQMKFLETAEQLYGVCDRNN